MKRNISDIISELLILLFTYAAVSKLIDRNHFEAVLHQMILINQFTGFVSITVPITELVASCLLFFSATRMTGLYLSSGLLLSFSVYIAFIITFEPKLPCNCGGVLEQLSWSQHLVFNLVFIILSLIAIKIRLNKNIVATDRLPVQQPQGKS